MKTQLLIILTLACSFTSAKPADEPIPVTRNSVYKKMVHFNPLALTIGGFELGYETMLSNKESFYINLGYYLSEAAGSLDVKDDYSNLNGFRLEMQYRFYRKSNNYMRNVYLAPFFNIKTISADHHETTYTYSPVYTKTTISENRSATTASFGYMLGMRKSVFENIYMDMAIGGGVFLPVQGDNHKDLNIGLFNPYQKGVQFKAAFGFLVAL